MTLRRRLERLETTPAGASVVAFFTGSPAQIEAQRADWTARHGRAPDVTFRTVYEDPPEDLDDGGPHAA